MQIVLYVHANQEELPEHAKVIEVTPETADGVRLAAHGAVDALLNDIKAGWTPPVEAAEGAETPAQEAAEAVVAAERPGQRNRPSSGGGRKGGERMPSRKRPSKPRRR